MLSNLIVIIFLSWMIIEPYLNITKLTKTIVLCLYLIILLIPALYQLYCFFESPRLKTKRICFNIIEYVFGKDTEAFLSWLSLTGNPLYCNEIKNNTCYCPHKRQLQIGNSFENYLGFEEINLDLKFSAFLKNISENDRILFDSLGFIKINSYNQIVWRNINYKDLNKILYTFTEKESHISFRQNIENTEMMFSYYPFLKKVKYKRVSSLCKENVKKDIMGVSLNNLLYTIKAFDFIKKDSRTCCLVVKDMKVFKKGKWARSHCIKIDDLTSSLLKGEKLVFGQEFEEGIVKVVEGSSEFLENSLFFKFGSVAKLIISFIKKSVESDKSEWVLNRLLKCESSKRANDCPLNNWQWKRKCVDISFIRESCGGSPMCGIDRSIKPTLLVTHFLKNNSCEINKIIMKKNDEIIVRHIPKIIGLNKEMSLEYKKELNKDDSKHFSGMTAIKERVTNILDKMSSIKNIYDEKEIRIKNRDRNYCDVVKSYKSVNTVKKGECKNKWRKFVETGNIEYIYRESRENNVKIEFFEKKNIIKSNFNRLKAVLNNEEGKTVNKTDALQDYEKIIKSEEINKISSKNVYIKKVLKNLKKEMKIKFPLAKTVYEMISDKEHFDYTQEPSIYKIKKFESIIDKLCFKKNYKKIRKSQNLKKQKLNKEEGSTSSQCKKMSKLYEKMKNKELKRENNKNKDKNNNENENKNKIINNRENKSVLFKTSQNEHVNKQNEYENKNLNIETFKLAFNNIKNVENYLEKKAEEKILKSFSNAISNINTIKLFLENESVENNKIKLKNKFLKWQKNRKRKEKHLTKTKIDWEEIVDNYKIITWEEYLSKNIYF